MEEERIFRDYLYPSKRKKFFATKGSWKEDCIFCSAINRLENKKLPSKIKLSKIYVFIVAKFGHTILVVNPYPYEPKGHLEIVTLRHIKEYEELTEEEIDEIFKKVIPKTKSALTREYKDVLGFNIGMNLGQGVGRSLEHFHIHLVPRFKPHAGFMEVALGTRVMEEHPEETMRKMGKYFK